MDNRKTNFVITNKKSGRGAAAEVAVGTALVDVKTAGNVLWEAVSDGSHRRGVTITDLRIGVKFINRTL